MTGVPDGAYFAHVFLSSVTNMPSGSNVSRNCANVSSAIPSKLTADTFSFTSTSSFASGVQSSSTGRFSVFSNGSSSCNCWLLAM